MKRMRLVRDGVALACLMGGWFALNQAGLKRLYSQQTQLTVRRFQKTARTLIERAHQAKDDLMMQETVQALAQAPGVFVACVIDENKKILAHNQPSQLGQNFSTAGLPRPLYAAGLSDGSKEWGRLILGISDRALQPARTFQIEMTLVAMGLLGGIFFAVRMHQEYRYAALRKQTVDLGQLLEEEKKARGRGEQASLEQRRHLMFWIGQTAEQVPQPLILLDHRQRVLAINKSAALRLGIVPQAVLEKSWQEIPALQTAAGALAQSIERPSQIVQMEGPPRLQLCSLGTPAEALLGTWITVE